MRTTKNKAVKDFTYIPYDPLSMSSGKRTRKGSRADSDGDGCRLRPCIEPCPHCRKPVPRSSETEGRRSAEDRNALSSERHNVAGQGGYARVSFDEPLS